MTDFETMRRVKWDGLENTELGRRMIYLKPSAERIANLLEDRQRNTKQLVGLGIVCLSACAGW